MNYTFHLCFSRLPFNLWTGRISKKSSLPFFAFYDGLYGNNCSEECLSSYSYTGCLYGEKYMVLRLSVFEIFLLFLWQLFIFLHLWIHSLCTLSCLSFLYILKYIHVLWRKYYMKNIFMYKNVANISNTVKQVFPQNLGALAWKLLSTKRGL